MQALAACGLRSTSSLQLCGDLTWHAYPTPPFGLSIP